MRALAPAVGAVWRAHGLVYAARFHLLRDEAAAAVELCERALGLYAATEVAERERGMCRVTLAFAFAALHRFDEAMAVLDGCRAHQTGGQAEMLEVQTLALRCCHALESGDAGLDELLRLALVKAEAAHAYAILLYLPRQAAALFDAALAREVQVDFVHRAVRQRRLPPPDPVQERWPWQLQLRVLGGFAIERDGIAVGVGRKAQKKPEELLKALLAEGGDADVDTLIEQLWPAEDAKDPRASFDMALSRLRRLLGVDGALVLAGGRLALDRRIVWCDAVAFDAWRLRLHAALAGLSAVQPVVGAVAHLAALHRGPLFGAATVAPWMLAARERLAMGWQRALQDAGAWLESRSEWRLAIGVYERGVAQQMFAEPLYRGLMRSHLALDERAEALLVYRRCHDMLSRALAIAPSEETRRLLEQAQRDGRSGP
jgi:DNA-binding SARP family transcriptional activator